MPGHWSISPSICLSSMAATSRAMPLLERKDRLATILKSRVRRGRVQRARGRDGEAFRRAACSHGLEGVVSKRTDRPYLPGDRGV